MTDKRRTHRIRAPLRESCAAIGVAFHTNAQTRVTRDNRGHARYFFGRAYSQSVTAKAAIGDGRDQTARRIASRKRPVQVLKNAYTRRACLGCGVVSRQLRNLGFGSCGSRERRLRLLLRGLSLSLRRCCLCLCSLDLIPSLLDLRIGASLSLLCCLLCAGGVRLSLGQIRPGTAGSTRGSGSRR